MEEKDFKEREGGHFFLDLSCKISYGFFNRNKRGKDYPNNLSLLFLINNLVQKLSPVCFTANTLYRFTPMVSIREAGITHIIDMIKTTKIRLKPGCTNPKSALEIDKIYLVGVNNEGFYDKAIVHDFVKEGNNVHVDIGPYYPKLVDAISSKGEKYVRSEPNDTPNDNLLKLPRA